MILLDVNILVHLHRADTDAHSRITEWMRGEVERAVEIGVSDLVLSGCLRIVTHPKIFTTPTPLIKAIDFIEDLRNRAAFTIVAPGPDHWPIFVRLCKEVEASGNAIPDVFHAALAIEKGCEWVTLDKAFERFPGLQVRNPIS